ncbi:FAD-dependent oxidoreductase [Actinotalea sp. JY-7885]|uniref:FAD-dependent oxidoreductase n=1 Tax=Actinotalea sp. JY-7885 TaxID=2758576 RepID=UPI00165E9B78|nr:FAD-dependent oxidoreductase [Actinotalea sp. JY-7885]
MQQRVVVVGGGYGGVAVASALQDDAEVTLVEPKDAFVHAVATLRAAVDPAWQDRVFFGYDTLLRRGRVVRDWARLVSPGVVHLSRSASLEADHVVLATGTGYPFPAKFLEDDTVVARARLERMREGLRQCERVMLIGAGPVGLELAGELTSAFPDLRVSIVEQEDDILPLGQYLPELRDAVRAQLAERRIDLVLGAPLGYLPPFDVGTYAPFTVETTEGEAVTAQMWFRCYGSRPMTGYLDTALADLRHYDGTLPVTEHLQVRGQDAVWAVGDITDVRESKRATAARDHAAVVVANIRDAIAGRAPSATYTAAPERIVLPLGPDGGASQVEQDGRRVILGPEETSRIKGADLFSGATAELFTGGTPHDREE